MSNCYLFDLDGTLLTSDKTLPAGALSVLEEYRREGKLIGVVTSRGESNCRSFLGRLAPDILITSGGAEIVIGGKKVFAGTFGAEAVTHMIATARSLMPDVNVTVDAADGTFYRNYRAEQDALEASWGDSVEGELDSFDKKALKVCFEIFDADKAEELISLLPECDAVRFTDGFWYKFTPHGVNKESAIIRACEYLGIGAEDITAFGDDIADIGMLKLAGTGVAMGNAAPEVKEEADVVIGSNDDDGIEIYLRTLRISAMEEVYDRVKLAGGRADKDDIRTLERYMATDFRSDYEADERGLIPQEIKRGVLSQDAIYDLLDEIELE